MKSSLLPFILAAGKGERLHPLTCFVPKPLLPIGEQPLIYLTLAQLSGTFEKVVVNAYHLADMLISSIKQFESPMKIIVSKEKWLRGTLGALLNLDLVFNYDYLMVVNGDSLAKWPIKDLLEFHEKNRNDVTLLVLKNADVSEYGGVLVDKYNRVKGFVKPGDAFRETLVFSGLHVLSTKILQDLSTSEKLEFVSDLYAHLASDKKYRFYVLARDFEWYDIGTPKRYLNAVCGWLRKNNSHLYDLNTNSCFMPNSLVVNSIVEDSVIMKNARVKDSVLKRCLVAPGAEIESLTLADSFIVASQWKQWLSGSCWREINNVFVKPI